jgi:hypothetical protein
MKQTILIHGSPDEKTFTVIEILPRQIVMGIVAVVVFYYATYLNIQN